MTFRWGPRFEKIKPKINFIGCTNKCSMLWINGNLGAISYFDEVSFDNRNSLPKIVTWFHGFMKNLDNWLLNATAERVTCNNGTPRFRFCGILFWRTAFNYCLTQSWRMNEYLCFWRMFEFLIFFIKFSDNSSNILKKLLVYYWG